MGADMTESWKDWEGRTVDGKFRLECYLGGSDASGMFRTEAEGTPVAIRIVPVGTADAEKELQRWKEASEIRLPNLIRILRMGSARVAGRDVAYVVEEYAEENLAQVIPERALTAEELRGMLKPVLVALESLHAKGFIHGGLRPSHIFAVGDQVKLSSDGLLKPGEVPRAADPLDAPELGASGASQATDVWSLGATLVEVMTQRVPMWDAARMTAPAVSEDVPEPFRAIAQHCLEIDPAKRWGMARIHERLEPGAQLATIRNAMTSGAAAPATKRTSNWRIWGGVVVVAIVAYLFLRAHSTEPKWHEVLPAAPPSTQTAPAKSPPEPQPSRPSPLVASKAPESGNEARAQAPAPNSDIVERAAPDVSASARRTIQGHIKVRVKVNVDAAGNVTAATLKDAGPSKYFARVAEEAAKRWKFVPAQGGQDEARSWTLLFVFSRAGTEMSAARAK